MGLPSTNLSMGNISDAIYGIGHRSDGKTLKQMARDAYAILPNGYSGLNSDPNSILEFAGWPGNIPFHMGSAHENLETIYCDLDSVYLGNDTTITALNCTVSWDITMSQSNSGDVWFIVKSGADQYYELTHHAISSTTHAQWLNQTFTVTPTSNIPIFELGIDCTHDFTHVTIFSVTVQINSVTLADSTPTTIVSPASVTFTKNYP